MSERKVLTYDDIGKARAFAEQEIFGVMGQYGSGELRKILEAYKNTHDTESLKDTGREYWRSSHLDEYNLCVYSGIIPPHLLLGNTIHPFGKELEHTDKVKLNDFFFEHRVEIIDKILAEVNDEDVFKTKRQVYTD